MYPLRTALAGGKLSCGISSKQCLSVSASVCPWLYAVQQCLYSKMGNYTGKLTTCQSSSKGVHTCMNTVCLYQMANSCTVGIQAIFSQKSRFFSQILRLFSQTHFEKIPVAGIFSNSSSKELERSRTFYVAFASMVPKNYDYRRLEASITRTA